MFSCFYESTGTKMMSCLTNFTLSWLAHVYVKSRSNHRLVSMSKVKHKAWWSYAFNTYLRVKRGHHCFYTCNLCITEFTVYWCFSSWIAGMTSISRWVQTKWSRDNRRSCLIESRSSDSEPWLEPSTLCRKVFIMSTGITIKTKACLYSYTPAGLYDNIPHVNKKLLN